MWIFTDIADWWDQERSKSEAILEQFVRDNPNQFGIIVATAAHTSMALGSGLVDILRIGDGVSQGSVKGVAQDGLRVLGIVGPMGKGIQLLKSQTNTSMAKLIVDSGGPICSWVASTKALAQTGYKSGKKIFASVDDLAKSVGINIQQIGGISLSAMASNLAKIGAKVGQVKSVNSLKDIIKIIPRNGNVVLVSLRGMKNNREIGGHAVYFFRDISGKVKIMDRTGTYNSLDELLQVYHQIDQFIPRTYIMIQNVYAKLVMPKGSFVLSIEVLGLVNDEVKHE